MAEEKKMMRSTQDKVLAGVCAGLGQYFNMDVTVMRIIFVILALLGGPGILLYIILWIVMPENPNA